VRGEGEGGSEERPKGLIFLRGSLLWRVYWSREQPDPENQQDPDVQQDPEDQQDPESQPGDENLNIDGGWAKLVTHYLGEMEEWEESLWENYVEPVLKGDTTESEAAALMEYLESRGLRLLREDEMTIARAWPFRMKRLDGDSGAAQDKCFQKYFRTSVDWGYY
jgi:hypothetical protein